MKDICQKYVNSFYKTMNNYLFIYKGDKINLESTFKELSNDSNELIISVFKYGNDKINCPKCGEKIKFNKDKMDDIIINENKTKDNINEFKQQFEKIINNTSNDSKENQIKNINELLNIMNQNISSNIKNFLNLYSDNETKDKKEENNQKISSSKNPNPHNINFFGNIKSKYIIEKIFEHFEEKKKLKTIKYNKYLQNKLDIKLVNYKFFSGKYIIFEKDGIGKEYNLDGYLEFEGEYLHGERNGKGKEYNNIGGIRFEGEYLNNKKNGKGKEYYCTGNLRFDGKFLDGKKLVGNEYDRKGNIVYQYNNLKEKRKEYDEYGLLTFEGEYLNGKKNGKGKVYYCGN